MQGVDEGVVVATLEIGSADGSAKERVTAEEQFPIVAKERDASRRVPGCVDGAQLYAVHLDVLVAVEPEIRIRDGLDVFAKPATCGIGHAGQDLRIGSVEEKGCASCLLHGLRCDHVIQVRVS